MPYRRDHHPRRQARAVAVDPRPAQRGALTLLTLVLLTLALLALGACGGGRDAREEAPARNGGAEPARSASPGEVVLPGATASMPDSAGLPGTAGSGTGAVGNATGSIGTPGEGTLHSGDPSDAAVRSVIDAINAGEVQAGQLALAKAQRPEVKRYAQAMVTAHRQRELDRGIEAAGSNSASDLLTPLVDLQTKTYARLQQLPAGPRFDREYVTSQVQAHDAALQLLDRAERATGDATLTDRIRAMRSSVERHLADARQLQASLGRATPP